MGKKTKLFSSNTFNSCVGLLIFATLPHQTLAADKILDKSIPDTRKDVDIPAGNLSTSLNRLSQNTGKPLIYDPALTQNKKNPALKGSFTPEEAFNRLLQNSGLEVVNDKQGNFELRRAPTVKNTESDNLPLNAELSAVEVRAKRFYEIGPLPGLGLTKEQIPGNVQSITAKEIKESHSLSITDLMNKKLQSVTVNDYQGNPFQMDVQYRGFTAGPQIGTPQGLSVFFDGIRVNEPFGDVVNWDMIPMNALASVDVFPGSNPIFGLNTLGGAFTVKTKDGFNHEGFDADVLTGSFGRKQLQVEGGWNNGTVALFGAGNFFLEDGWRENSPSKVNQFFGKASYRGDKLDLNLSTLIVGTDLVGNGLLPSEMYAQDRNSIYSSPDTTKNRLQQFQLSGAFQATDNFSITGQVYRRNSDRKQKGADVFTDYDEELTAKRIPADGEEYACKLNSSNSNKYGLPDYIVVPVANYNPNQPNRNIIDDSAFFQDLQNNGFVDINANYANLINKDLPDAFLASFRDSAEFNSNFRVYNSYNRERPPPPPGSGVTSPDFFDEASYRTDFDAVFQYLDSGGSGVIYNEGSYFFTENAGVITKNHVMILPPTNEANCIGVRGSPTFGFDIYDPNNTPILIDGIGAGQPGFVKGTPTAVITDNQIDQIVDGASIQFNWNLDHHKFMVGASIDAASAVYTNSQRLVFLDGNRNAYLDPAQAHPQFAAAYTPISNNDFSGTSTTKSIYFSETWTPTETWNFSASGRYNETQTKNKIAARKGLFAYGVGDVIAFPNEYVICPNNNCPNEPLNFKLPLLFNPLGASETEKFSYYSLNPSVGATWQAKENLNVYANLAQGTRTPSVIELGCAFDKTPAKGTNTPKSIFENRQCTLPTTLSGDPYLPQIKATTYDVGMRGTFNSLFNAENIQWNLGAYQTDLKDDIYFVTVGNGQGFFDTIGKTRRRGIEAGVSGRISKLGFSLNYGLTDATFEDSFIMISQDNSSSYFRSGYGNIIDVKPGSRIPGVSLHNLNANLTYEVTPKWQVGFSAVMHSESFLRGNENNEHKKGVVQYRQLILPPPIGTSIVGRQPTNNPGKVPGYVTLNFQTSYKLNPEWTATMLINNVLDKEYFTAGRLGRNPFSPSIIGAIGPDGYNHNSGDWLSTNFIAPSAPRGFWFSLRYSFVPDKK